MTARHAGESRIADQALIDQVRAAASDVRAWAGIDHDPFGPDLPACGTNGCPTWEWLTQRHAWLCNWAGRALALLEQIGEMAE